MISAAAAKPITILRTMMLTPFVRSCTPAFRNQFSDSRCVAGVRHSCSVSRLRGLNPQKRIPAERFPGPAKKLSAKRAGELVLASYRLSFGLSVADVRPKAVGPRLGECREGPCYRGFSPLAWVGRRAECRAVLARRVGNWVERRPKKQPFRWSRLDGRLRDVIMSLPASRRCPDDKPCGHRGRIRQFARVLWTTSYVSPPSAIAYLHRTPNLQFSPSILSLFPVPLGRVDFRYRVEFRRIE